jgi:hypothetical protein
MLVWTGWVFFRFAARDPSGSEREEDDGTYPTRLDGEASSLSSGLPVGGLEVEEPPFPPEARAIASETPIAPHDAMAGDDEGDGIPVGSSPDGTRSAGPAHPLGELSIRCLRTIGDPEHLGPDLDIEPGGAGQVEFEVELLAIAAEVLDNLLERGSDRIVALIRIFEGRWSGLRLRPTWDLDVKHRRSSIGDRHVADR